MLSLLFSYSFSRVYLEEHFNPGWEKNWARPDKVKRGVLLGKFRSSAGAYYADEKKQRGLETMDAHRYYLFYSNFTEPFDTRDKDLIIQFTVRLDMYIDCAGAYIKLLGPPTKQTEFSNETFYSIMFGPDICGANLHQTKVSIGYNDEYYPIKDNINANKDHLTHGYTLIIRKDNTIEVKIDGETKSSGKLSDLFSIPTVSSIPDPKSKKPFDWDDVEYIVDENDVKPDDWVDDEFIEDPDAFRPPTFDDSVEWVPPMIKNPDYIGEWKPRFIPNPNFKGFWKPDMIEVDPMPDPQFGHFPSLTYLGIDIFQSCPGTILGNFLVTDDEKYAEKALIEAFLSIRSDEIESFDTHSDQAKRDKAKDTRFNEKDYDMFKKLDAISSDDDVSKNANKLKAQKEKEKIKEKKLKKKEQHDYLTEL